MLMLMLLTLILQVAKNQHHYAFFSRYDGYDDDGGGGGDGDADVEDDVTRMMDRL